MSTEKTFEIDGLQPNSQYTLRVRALYRNGSYSEWSKTFKLKVKGDGTPPSQPSAPTIFVPDLTTELSRNSSAMGPQTIRFRHDSTKNGGGPLEGDIDYFEVYVNTTNSNSGGTQIGTVKATRPGSGAFAESNLPVNAPGDSNSRWFYVIAVDMSGLRSPASPTTQATAIPMIANAYISDLSADKITTGTLQASQKITVGDTVAIALKSNTTSPKAEFFAYSGSEPAVGAGYDNNSVGFYMDSTGRFSLKKALTFDPSANGGEGLLTINAAGTFSGALSSEIELSAPVITGGSINIGPDIFQVNSSGRVIATNIESAIIKGGEIWIGGTSSSNANFYVDSSGNLITRGSATIAGPVISGGSMTAGLFKTSAVSGINRIEIDGNSQKDNVRFLNAGDGNFEIRIAGPNLNIDNNYPGTLGTGWTDSPQVRIRSNVSVLPNSDDVALRVYRPGSNGTNAISRFFSNYNSTENEVNKVLMNGNVQNLLGGYGTFSDERLKISMSPSRGYLPDLMNIEIIKYKLIGNDNEELLGFSAQQVQNVFPGIISEDEDGYLGVKTSIFIPMLITAVQELNNRVQYLEAKLEELNG